MDTSSPAFPRHPECDHGMSLRDWFASQAMIGQLAAEPPDVEYTHECIAARAYAFADAMLVERQK